MAKTQHTADAEMAVLDGISPDTHPARDTTHFRHIIAARKAVELADDGLRRAIADARAAGDSWTVIGAALGTTRQNAYQRFGRDSKL